MGVRGVLTRLLPGTETDVIIECRHCGRPVDPPREGASECPNCGATEFSRYEIPQ